MVVKINSNFLPQNKLPKWKKRKSKKGLSQLACIYLAWVSPSMTVATDIINFSPWTCSLYCSSVAYYVLIDWVGGPDGKIFGSRSGRTDRAQRGPYILTESQIFSRPARPYSVNKHFLIWPLITVENFQNFCLKLNRTRLHKIRRLRALNHYMLHWNFCEDSRKCRHRFRLFVRLFVDLLDSLKQGTTGNWILMTQMLAPANSVWVCWLCWLCWCSGKQASFYIIWMNCTVINNYPAKSRGISSDT